MLDYHHFKYMS